jgi:hypothetical protein
VASRELTGGSERPLTPDERAELSARLTRARQERATALVKTALSATIVCGILAVITMAASTAPWWVIVPFWSGLVVIFTLWIGLPWHRLMTQQVASLSDALRTSRARVTEVHSSRVVEFEEEEDEGACWAFEHGRGASLFVVGQEFYEDDDFPNSEFAIVDLLGSRGQTVDSLLMKTGRKLTPERVVPASVKRLVAIPDSFTIVDAPIEDVENRLDRLRP